MSRIPLLISFVRAQDERVLEMLVQKTGYDLAVFAAAVTPSLRNAVAATGAALLVSDAPPANRESDEITTRVAGIASLLDEHVADHPLVAQFGAKAVADSVLARLPERMAATIGLIDALDAILQTHVPAALLVNETDLHVSRTAALWARRNEVPIFLLSSRTNIGEALTVTAKVLADYIFVFGERGAHRYFDLGIPAERIVLTGNPGWDHYGEVLKHRGRYRSEVFANHKLKGGAPLLVFATTWNPKFSALVAAELYEQTARAFLRACRVLRERGVAFNAVIKDLPSKARDGRALIARIALEEGTSDYVYAAGDMPLYLCAADVLAGYDASVFVEAMLAGVPAVNIWCPSSWLTGPAFERRDGIALLPHDSADALAATLHRLLSDAPARMELANQQGRRAEFFHIAPDGASANRCARAIVERLKAIA